MKLLPTLIFACLMCVSSGVAATVAATIQFRLFTIQGEWPEISDLIRLYESGAIEPTISSHAIIDTKGNFQKIKQETIIMPTGYSDDGKPTEYLTTPIGYSVYGTITGKDSSLLAKINFTHSQRIGDMFFRGAKNTLIAKPLISTVSLDTEKTISINKWFCMPVFNPDGPNLIFVVKVEK